jgi:hypothetical protein
MGWHLRQYYERRQEMNMLTPEQPKPFDVYSPDVSHAVIEIFGGDNNLSPFVLEDLQEMAAGMQGPFSVLALADFANRGASVVELSPHTGGRVLEAWGEIDCGDPNVLADFLSRALVTYSPSTRKAIGFWDHGTGVFDEHDPNEIILERSLRSASRRMRSRSMPARRLFISRGMLASNPRERAMLHDDTNGGLLTNREAHGVIKAAFNRSNYPGPIDLIFSDTCLNGMIEVLEQFKEFATVVIGSEDLEPGDGWDYYEWFRRMSDQPSQDAETWARQATEAFEQGYQGRFNAYPCTLGAFRSSQTITQEFRDLVEKCDNHGKIGFDWLREARDNAQGFANHDTYDIRDFATKLKDISSDDAVKTACENVISAFDQARVHAVALGTEVADSHGLAFWFPNNRYAFRQVMSTYKELKFHKATGWADYLQNQFFPV